MKFKEFFHYSNPLLHGPTIEWNEGPGGEMSIARRGFRQHLCNGYSVSVQFHWGAMCSARNRFDNIPARNAEVAVFTPDEEILHETVDGWQTPAKVMDLLTRVSRW